MPELNRDLPNKSISSRKRTKRTTEGSTLGASERRLILGLVDGIIQLVAVYFSLRIWALVDESKPFDFAFISARFGWFILLPSLWFVLCTINDFYNLRTLLSMRVSLRALFGLWAQLLVIYVVIFFLASRDQLPRLFIVYHIVISSVLILAWRGLLINRLGWATQKRRLLIIGTGRNADTIFNLLMTYAGSVYEVLGYIESDTDPRTDEIQDGKSRVVGVGIDLPKLVKENNISQLVLTYGAEMPADIFQGLMACYEFGIAITPMPILYEQITGQVPIENVGTHWSVVLPMEGLSLGRRAFLFLKRVVDVSCALIGLAIFTLIFPILMVIIFLDSPGSIFYRQERVGRGGKSFFVIKLRTMIPNAEKLSGPVWALEADPRVTRVGRFLRKMRIDEVPQLWNVLRGEMSIVGPRPERPIFVDQLAQEIPFYRTRLVVMPGLTGWAQVCYRYGNTSDDAVKKLQYDLYYIRHQSLILDTIIMFRTIRTMIRFEGT